MFPAQSPLHAQDRVINQGCLRRHGDGWDSAPVRLKSGLKDAGPTRLSVEQHL
jgi:hypothetical protein